MSDHPQQHIKYFWEDLPVGTTLDIGSTTVDRDEVIAFASKYDPQPFHLDEAAAAKSMFGKLSASGWHTCAMAMGLMVRGFLHESSSLGSPGLEKVSWLTPVYPGDTLTLKQTILESRPMKSRPDVAVGDVQPARRAGADDGRLWHGQAADAGACGFGIKISASA